MKKIPTLFARDFTDPHRPVLTDQVTPGCEWVLAGEGTATRKVDGVAVLHDTDGWWSRRMVKAGKTAPPGFREAQHDPTTGHRFGWEPIEQSPFVKMWREAVEPLVDFAAVMAGLGAGDLIGDDLPHGTFELIGPKINGNPENAEHHRLEPHFNAERVALAEPTCLCADDDACEHPWRDLPDQDPWALVELCRDLGYEGVVWHHPDGRMAKLKVRDLAQRVQP